MWVPREGDKGVISPNRYTSTLPPVSCELRVKSSLRSLPNLEELSLRRVRA